jgi:hypothetical protein
MVEALVPDAAIRRDLLEFFAFAIENVDQERSSSWYLRETYRGLRLMAGRFLACEFLRSTLRVTVVGPVDDEVRRSLGADPQNDDEFKKVPGSVVVAFPIEHAAKARALLADGFDSFVDLVMARVRSPVGLDDHCPEAVAYVASVVGRDLPQPDPSGAPNELDQDSDDDEEIATSREARARGRAPIFEPGQRSIASLVSDIERDVIALPDLQRPFVWEDTKVRDLLDSLFLGFPVGTLVLWHTSADKEARAVGGARPGLRASTLIIDGQQRLTSLFAVLRGVEIVSKEGERRKISIAFRPRDGRFEVADAAIRRDPEFLPNITELWSGKRSKPQIRRDLLKALADKGRSVDEAYADAVERNLDRAHAINDYRLPTVEIRKTASGEGQEATEEDVAEIFVRINNQGTRLGQADFVLTLLSVFHEELRDRIEERARSMSQGSVIGIDTQQLLRAVCGVAFGRARMSAVYRSLRGVDPVTGETDSVGREARLRRLDEAANECMESTPWRDFLLRVKHAGFVSSSLIASRNAIVNAFTFYVRGRKAGVSKAKLEELISRWVFGSLLSARYSGSSETMFEQDLARLERLGRNDSAEFVRTLDQALSEVLTGDYWTVTLVSSLETQKGRAPSALAFRAAQVVLGARALFSDQLLQNLLDDGPESSRTASEAHHLFPQAWLHARGITERRLVNQVANLADVGWHENSVIGGRSPSDYIPKVRESLSIDDARWSRMCAEHALPPGWEKMDYDVFLRERRSRMADITRAAFRKLGGEEDTAPLTPPWFLPGAETVWSRIGEVELALRGLVREVYSGKFGDAAVQHIQDALPERERETLIRSLRSRPQGSDSLSIVDYLYLGQLPGLVFSADVWTEAKRRIGDKPEAKRLLQEAISDISPVRNEIAHVREVDRDRLLRATVACADVMKLLRASQVGS